MSGDAGHDPASKPWDGIPSNPERDGWHALRVLTAHGSQRPEVAHWWDAERKAWFINHYRFQTNLVLIGKLYQYSGPLMASAQLAATRRAALEEAVRECELENEDGNGNAFACIERIRALPAAAPDAGDGWQPIETAPKNGTAVLVTAPHGQYVVTWEDADGEQTEYAHWHVHDNKHGPFPLRGSSPTHWRPLPDPPRSDGKGVE